MDSAFHLAIWVPLALQQHQLVVSIYERRAKVFQDILRPLFSFLDTRPLAERCTHLSYDSVREVAYLKHLVHLADSVLDEYAEDAE